MAFQPQNFSRSSKSANEDIVNIQSPTLTSNTGTRLFTDVQGCFRRYNYLSMTYPGPTQGQAQAAPTGDSLGSILTWPIANNGAGYFDKVVNDLQVGDLIDVYSYVDSSYITFTVTAINSEAPQVSIAPIGAAKGNIILSSAEITSLGPVTGAASNILINGGLNYTVGLTYLKTSIAAVPTGSTTIAAYTAGANINVDYVAVTGKTDTTLNSTNVLGGTTTIASTVLTNTTASCNYYTGITITSAYMGPPAATSLAGYNIQLGTATAFTMAANKVGNPLNLAYEYTIYPLM